MNRQSGLPNLALSNGVSMKRFALPTIVVLSCLSVTAPAAQAEFKCDGRPLTSVDAKACAHAAQGADSLRRFVTRTRAIYGLQLWDYVRVVDDEPATKVASTPSKGSLAKVPPSSN